MTEGIQFAVLLAALGMFGYGLWLIAPAAMFVGVGGMLLAAVVVTRLSKGGSKNVRRNP